VPYSDNGLHATFSGLFSDVVIEWIDLAPLLNSRPSSTFFCRVNGDSMKDERLQDGDIVIVDKSLPLQDGKKVIVWIAQENGWTVKRLSMKDGMIYLIPANEKLRPYLVTADDIFWGVVTWILHKE
jgi:DNA polymerase V